MTKKFKSVSLMLCLLAMSTGSAMATTSAAPISAPVVQQSETATGTVVDAMGPVIGASVVVKGTTNGVITDFDGNFTLSNVKKGDVIQVSFVGYATQEIVWDGKVMNITLKEDTEVLEEVVVTAYGGKTLRSKMTNSIAKVKSEALTTGLHSNPAQALSGAVAGLSVSQTSGNPGAAPTLILRGGTDFSGSGSPLILVDGQVRGSLSDINPADIESMEVMKDAGATAIYGARANNGVVLVTTKRGKEGSARVDFSAKLGLNYFQDSYNFMNARDYIYWMRTGYMNAHTGDMKHPDGSQVATWSNISTLTGSTPYGTGNKYFDANGNVLDGNKTSQAIWSTMKYSDDLAFLLKQGWETMTDPVYGDKLIFKNFNIADFNLNTPAISQDYNVSLSGGNEKGHYYAGIGYNDSEGNAYGNKYSRLTFTFNGDYKINKWLTSTSNFSYANASWNDLPPTQTAEANYFSRVLSLPPTFRGYNADGEMLLGPNSGDGNQQLNFDSFVRDNKTDKFTMNQSFTIDFNKDLSLKLSAILFYNEGMYESFNKDYMSSPGNTNKSHSSSAQFDRSIDQTYNAILNYRKQINKDHYVDAMAGFEYYDTYNRGFSASGSGAPTDAFQDLEYTITDEGKRSIDSWHSRQRIMSFFGRVNYDYQGKYLLSAVVRRDGYSKLAKDERWGIFPGISAGWVFTKEEFAEKFADILSFGKFRASYGANGNVHKDWVGNYTVQGAYATTTNYAGSNAFLLSSIPNPYLTWEKSYTFEAGFDLGFLENRINANLTYYNRLTTDKFASITIPATSGATAFTSNNGKYRNQGLEFELGFKILDQKDWKWNLNWNGAYSISKVVQLPDNGLPNNRQSAFQVYTGKGNELAWVGGYQEGQRPGDVYAFVAEGIYRNESEIPAGLIDISSGNNGSSNRPLYGGAEGYNKLSDSQKKNALPIQVGDVKWKDVNKDGVIDNYDKVKIGNQRPKWTGGINTQVSWKDLTLSARFGYALGFTAIDYKTMWIMSCAQGTYNTIAETWDTFSAENPNGKYPTYVWADQLGKRNYCRENSMFMYKGDYIAFRELSLGYNLPKSWVTKAGLGSVMLSLTAQNLGYLTEADHLFSPEQANNNGGYPLPRTFVFGVNVSF